MAQVFFRLKLINVRVFIHALADSYGNRKCGQEKESVWKRFFWQKGPFEQRHDAELGSMTKLSLEMIVDAEIGEIWRIEMICIWKSLVVRLQGIIVRELSRSAEKGLEKSALETRYRG